MIARSSIGLAVRTGAPAPDVSSAEAVKRTLLAAKTFARNEGAESGRHMLSVFARLGITEQMAGKTKAMPVGTGYVAELVARGEAEMAAQQMPELKAVAGVDPFPLPPELQLIIVFSAGVSPAPKEPEAVNALVAFLSSPQRGRAIRGQRARSAAKRSIAPEHHRGEPAGEHRHHRGGQAVEEAVVARRGRDELLEADLDDLERRIAARDHLPVARTPRTSTS